MAQYVIDNADSDGTAFDVPGDVTGAPDSYDLNDPDNSQHYVWYIHIENGFDVNVDVTVEGSHYQDSTLASAAIDGSTETVSAGAQDFFDGTTKHSFIGLQVDPAADPTSGQLTVTFQKRRA